MINGPHVYGQNTPLPSKASLLWSKDPTTVVKRPHNYGQKTPQLWSKDPTTVVTWPHYCGQNTPTTMVKRSHYYGQIASLLWSKDPTIKDNYFPFAIGRLISLTRKKEHIGLLHGAPWGGWIMSQSALVQWRQKLYHYSIFALENLCIKSSLSKTVADRSKVEH